MPCRQQHKLLAQAVEKWRRADQQRTSTLLGQGCESGAEITFGIGGQYEELYAQARCRVLQIAYLDFGTRIVLVDERCNGCGFGNQVVQQTEPLRLEACGELVNPGHIAAGPVETVNKPGLYRVVADGKDNWDC